MIHVRKAGERGQANRGGLDPFPAFSGAGDHDPATRGFRSLRVIYEDVVAHGAVVPSHPHRNMEILLFDLA